MCRAKKIMIFLFNQRCMYFCLFCLLVFDLSFKLLEKYPPASCWPCLLIISLLQALGEISSRKLLTLPSAPSCLHWCCRGRDHFAQKTSASTPTHVSKSITQYSKYTLIRRTKGCKISLIKWPRAPMSFNQFESKWLKVFRESVKVGATN